MLVDPFGRAIDYLRLSVTDRCDLRCVYCLPLLRARFSPPGEVLSDDEVLSLVACFARLGVSRVRVTGGEPLVRPGLPDLIGGVARLPGISEVSLSTNGMLLSRLAPDLARAGLRRVNVSLDTLRPERFRAIARGGDYQAVFLGVSAALAAGLAPLKINVVVARGMNEDEVPDFVRLTERFPLHVRFIELMPMGEAGFFSRARWVSQGEILERAAPLEPIPRGEWPAGGGPARYYRRPGARGTIGIISALGCGFCDSCNRMRLSSLGVLYPCLDSGLGVDLKGPLRAGLGPEGIGELIREAVRLKPERHTMRERMSRPETERAMCRIGG